MTALGPTYNERAWAIDLIGHLKHLARQRERPIKDAGGERTIRSEGGVLFPDVLLFGDRSTARILQGWELKMPDTSIHDLEFRQNAEAKARALDLDSFLLWNVSVAQLFVRVQGSEDYVLENTWSDLADITDRGDALLGRTHLAGLAANDPAAAGGMLEAEVGYGLPAFGGRFTGRPWLGFGATPTTRAWRLGWRLTPAGRNAFALGVEATRNESANATVDSLLLRLDVYF